MANVLWKNPLTEVYTHPLTVLKSVGPKLVPFFKTTAVFFVLFGEGAYTNSLFYAVIKCLPIFSLIVFVLLHGMNFTEAYAYSRKILVGLVLCSIGDAFLVWKSHYFLHGLISFALGHVAYSAAFGVSPINPIAGGLFACLAALSYAYIYRGLEGMLVYAGGAYCILIWFMAWRAVSRLRLIDDIWTWTKLCSCVGAFFFVTSDFIISVNKFLYPVPYEHQLVMITYYFAQLCITLSVVDSQADELLKKTKDRKLATEQ